MKKNSTFYEIRTKTYVTDVWDEFSDYISENRKAFYHHPGYYVRFVCIRNLLITLFF